MKRGKKMILLLAALAVAVGGYFAVQGIGKKQTVDETAGTFDLNAKTADDLIGLSWTVGENTLMFKLEDGVWQTMDETAWPVDQEALQNLADRLIGLQATRKLEKVENPADYGLETPAAAVTAVWKNGSSTTYTMGDATPFDDGYYLSLSEQDGTVYTISSSLAELFGKTRKELTAMEEIPAVANVTGLKIGSTLNLIKAEESRTVDPDQLWYDAETGEPVDGDAAEDLISTAEAITWTDLETANADEEQLNTWMLTEDKALTVQLTGTDGESSTILFGASKEDEYYYARLPGSSMVYTVNSGNVISLMNADKEDMQIDTLLPMPYETLARAEFSTAKGTYVLDRTAASGSEDGLSGQPSDETAEEKPESENSAETTADEAETLQKKLWAAVTALKTEGAAEKEPGEQVLSIHAVNTDGKECTVVFLEDSADTYQAVADNGTAQKVSAEDIDAIIRTVRSMQ